MHIGERIKQARLEAGLSQRQLCGDVITRNMLSLIESGKARPGMDTLAFLASQLEKPIAWFLEEQAVVSPNQGVMAAARASLTEGDCRQVLAVLERYRAPDDMFDQERYFLGALAATLLAEQAVAEGKMAFARGLLEQAEQWAEQTAYDTDYARRQRVLLQFQAEPARARELASRLPADDRELLLRGQAALDDGDSARCAAILDAAGVRGADWCLLRGQAAVAAGEFSAAAAYLRRAEEAFPRVCVPLLEQCYRELEDFKLAYEYACKQRG